MKINLYLFYKIEFYIGVTVTVFIQSRHMKWNSIQDDMTQPCWNIASSEPSEMIQKGSEPPLQLSWLPIYFPVHAYVSSSCFFFTFLFILLRNIFTSLEQVIQRFLFLCPFYVFFVSSPFQVETLLRLVKSSKKLFFLFQILLNTRIQRARCCMQYQLTISWTCY